MDTASLSRIIIRILTIIDRYESWTIKTCLAYSRTQITAYKLIAFLDSLDKSSCSLGVSDFVLSSKNSIIVSKTYNKSR